VLDPKPIQLAPGDEAAPELLLDHALGVIRHSGQHLYVVAPFREELGNRMKPRPCRGDLGREMLRKDQNPHRPQPPWDRAMV